MSNDNKLTVNLEQICYIEEIVYDIYFLHICHIVHVTLQINIIISIISSTPNQ